MMALTIECTIASGSGDFDSVLAGLGTMADGLTYGVEFAFSSACGGVLTGSMPSSVASLMTLSSACTGVVSGTGVTAVPSP